MAFQHLKEPKNGTAITQGTDGKLVVPDDPIIPFIEGDGIGPDIWSATQTVLDAAVDKAYGGKRRIEWFEVYAGEKAQKRFKEWLPEDTLEAMRTYRVAIKGPLTTPVGEGTRRMDPCSPERLRRRVDRPPSLV